jgi:uncharacterized phage-associated protein
MELTPEVIGCCFVEKLHKLDIDDTTQLKIQKLIYFAWVWYGVL